MYPMSWASRRRFLYASGVILFFGLLIGIPVLMYLSEPARCDDGVMNGGETGVDMGGPCRLLDERYLVPHTVLWTRAMPVRGGAHSVVAYVENPNPAAGVMRAPYRFKLYDERSVIVAERTGTAFIMPGGTTPIFEGAIDTGNRAVSRAYFEFTAPLVWERMYDTSEPIQVLSKNITNATAVPRLEAMIENKSVAELRDVELVAVVFDTIGNAFAASATIVPLLHDGERKELVFTWPEAFTYLPGRIDVLPIREPQYVKPL